MNRMELIPWAEDDLWLLQRTQRDPEMTPPPRVVTHVTATSWLMHVPRRVEWPGTGPPMAEARVPTRETATP